MKVTKKYLTNWINEKLPDVNVEVKLKDIKVINTNTNKVMGFVYKLLFILETESKHPIYIYSYYTLKEMTDHLSTGKYELNWKFKGNTRWIANSEIDLKKI